MHSLGVIHGRFQVLHNDHLKYLLAGKERCKHLVIGITNPDPDKTRAEQADPNRSAPANNPLTFWERHVMIREAMLGAGVPHDEFSITPLPINQPELIGNYVPLEAVFFLTIYDDWGRAKLHRFKEMGLQTDVLWERDPAHKGISASEIRASIRQGLPINDLVPPSTARLAAEWNLKARLHDK